MTDSPVSESPAEAPPEARTPRAPQQERGLRRVEQIVDAAESVFAEMGVDAVSMQLIADRAGSSVGSLYHFFPNKDAIVEALGRRYAERMRETNEAAMPLELARLGVEELFERVLSAQIRFIERTPAFGAIQQAVHRNCPAIYDALNQAIVGHVGQFLALRYPRMSSDERTASALVSVATVHAIVALAYKLPKPVREHVIREARAMLVAHFREYDRQR